MIFSGIPNFECTNDFFNSKQNSDCNLIGAMIFVLNELNTKVLKGWMHVDVELLAC